LVEKARQGKGKRREEKEKRSTYIQIYTLIIKCGERRRDARKTKKTKERERKRRLARLTGAEAMKGVLLSLKE
jgi:hypothetical protein